MSISISQKQKQLLEWLVHNVENGKLNGEFLLRVESFGVAFPDYKGIEIPNFNILSFKVLSDKGYLLNYKVNENTEKYILTGLAYITIAHNFMEPDKSFSNQAKPLFEGSTLDEEIIKRCLPILGADINNPHLWDAVIRTACVILEDRIRKVGKVKEEKRVGRDLVNDVFGEKGTLANKFSNISERGGYRELFAGMVGAVRNPYAHRFIDPKPEDARAILLFINFLLKFLGDLK
jgi:hypothetical protein